MFSKAIKTGHLQSSVGHVPSRFSNAKSLSSRQEIKRTAQYDEDDVCRQDTAAEPVTIISVAVSQIATNCTTGFGPAALREEPPPKVNMAALEDDYNLKTKLSAIGLGPMADWVSYGYQWHAIPGSIILACATIFTRYLDAVPTEAKHLDGTPYSDTQNMDDNLDSNGCVEYRGELEPSFRNTAQFGDSCRGEHC